MIHSISSPDCNWKGLRRGRKTTHSSHPFLPLFAHCLPPFGRTCSTKFPSSLHSSCISHAIADCTSSCAASTASSPITSALFERKKNSQPVYVAACHSSKQQQQLKQEAGSRGNKRHEDRAKNDKWAEFMRHRQLQVWHHILLSFFLLLLPKIIVLLAKPSDAAVADMGKISGRRRWEVGGGRGSEAKEGKFDARHE